MYLIHPFFANDDTSTPNLTLSAHAQALCEEFARRLGGACPVYRFCDNGIVAQTALIIA